MLRPQRLRPYERVLLWCLGLLLFGAGLIGALLACKAGYWTGAAAGIATVALAAVCHRLAFSLMATSTLGRAQIARRIAVTVVLLLVFATRSHAGEQRLGFVTQLEGEGFFLNPLVKRILVTDVTKGSIAEAAGMRAGDEIIQIEGQSVVGRRARELQPFMKLNPGETRTLRLKHADGTEVDARITKPKT